MKKLIIPVIMLVSCNTESSRQKQASEIKKEPITHANDWVKLETVLHTDSCEYIIATNERNYTALGICHSGNCHNKIHKTL